MQLMSDMSRREFFEKSLVAAAACGLPTMIDGPTAYWPIADLLPNRSPEEIAASLGSVEFPDEMLAYFDDAIERMKRRDACGLSAMLERTEAGP